MDGSFADEYFSASHPVGFADDPFRFHTLDEARGPIIADLQAPLHKLVEALPSRETIATASSYNSSLDEPPTSPISPEIQARSSSDSSVTACTYWGSP